MFELHQKLKSMKTGHKDIYVCDSVTLTMLMCCIFTEGTEGEGGVIGKEDKR